MNTQWPNRALRLGRPALECMRQCTRWQNLWTSQLTMNEYLKSTDVIDWEHPAVAQQARILRDSLSEPSDVARACFEWVRDAIKHSVDYKLKPVTCQASEVLQEGSGYCYAKSHLLAALLRANGLAAGLCYQRISCDDVGEKFCLHGFNAVNLPGYGWYRMDARGNKPGVDAQFKPPQEQLAFTLTMKGEVTLPEIWAEPLPVVVEALRSHTDAQVLMWELPDIEVWTG